MLKNYETHSGGTDVYAGFGNFGKSAFAEFVGSIEKKNDFVRKMQQTMARLSVNYILNVSFTAFPETWARDIDAL